MKPREFSKGKRDRGPMNQVWCDGNTAQIQRERSENAADVGFDHGGSHEPTTVWYLTEQLTTVQREAGKGKKSDSPKGKATMQMFLF